MSQGLPATWIDRFFEQLTIKLSSVLPFHSVLQFVAGSGVTITPTEDLPNDANVLTISASGGGGGSPGGTTNDVQICGAGSTFVADTGNFTYDPTNHNLIGGAGCNISAGTHVFLFGGSCSGSSDYGIAMGASCEANATAAVAIGDQCIANGTASCATGVYTTTFRYGERAHYSGSSGNPTAEDSHLAGFYGLGSAAPVNLADAVSTELTLEDGKVYSMRARLMASQTSSGKRAHEIHELLLHAHGGTLVIDRDDTITNTAVNFASLGYTLTISTPGGLVLRFACDPAADTVRFFAVCEWSALPDT